MENKSNKRQIYLWDENKEFYDNLPNKSKLINLLIRKYQEEHCSSVNLSKTNQEEHCVDGRPES